MKELFWFLFRVADNAGETVFNAHDYPSIGAESGMWMVRISLISCVKNFPKENVLREQKLSNCSCDQRQSSRRRLNG